MILDTTFLHDVMHGDEDVVRLARRVEERRNVGISSVTVYELYYGVGYTGKDSDEREKVDAVIGSKRVLPADADVMRKAGRIDGELARGGEMVGQADVMIGATAIVHDEPVLTRNEDDFERIPGVEVETY